VRVIEQLAELSDLEAELAAADLELAQIAARAQGDPELARLRGRRTELEAEAQRAAAARRSEELELGALAERLQHQERALYDGSVRHPGDLQRREHELAGMRGRRSDHEERVLAAMEAEEAAQAELEAASSAVTAAEAHAAERGVADAVRLPSLERARRAAADRREQCLAAVPEAGLRVYRRTAAHRTPAVARVRHGTCSGCRLPVPPRLLDQARRDQLAVCETCERLLLL